jgi:hypothetical protein
VEQGQLALHVSAGKNMKSSLLMLLLGLSCQGYVQSPSEDIEGSWQSTLEADGTKLRLVLTVTRSDAGAYAAQLDSLDQGAAIPVDTITVNSDAVRLEMKSVEAVFEGVRNKKGTELSGKFTQSGQELPLTFQRSEHAAAMPPKLPKPDYSAPADAPYIAEEVVVKTPAGHTLAGTLTLPKGASRAKPVGAIVTVTGSGPQDRDENLGRFQTVSSIGGSIGSTQHCGSANGRPWRRRVGRTVQRCHHGRFR